MQQGLPRAAQAAQAAQQGLPRAARPAQRLNPNKIIAVLLWIGAVYTTALCLQALSPSLDGWLLWAWAVAGQAVLTVLESPVWAGRRQDVNVTAVAIDMAVNAGGLWPIVRHIDQTPTWSMIIDVTGAQATMSTAAAVLISVGLGFVLAKAPEIIWRQG